ncbi:hypothetical protein SAMN05216327_101198 [Dyadobacter sp. SG02]|nr:hypothetical protein SAMN05216327_101198 [Dyadobacter sp. SG02]
MLLSYTVLHKIFHHHTINQRVDLWKSQKNAPCHTPDPATPCGNRQLFEGGRSAIYDIGGQNSISDD